MKSPRAITTVWKRLATPKDAACEPLRECEKLRRIKDEGRIFELEQEPGELERLKKRYIGFDLAWERFRGVELFLRRLQSTNKVAFCRPNFWRSGTERLSGSGGLGAN